MIDLELRRGRISATDVGPIFGVDQYRGPFEVWADKHGHAPPFEPTGRMLMGKDLEQGIVKAYSRITGRLVQWKDETVVHPTRSWMAASPDALVYAGDRVERTVDAKLVFWDQRRKWEVEPPEGVQFQMWWQMAVTNCEVCDVAAWLGDDAPRIYTIERNHEAERVMISKCEEWHRRYVLGDEIPPISGSKTAAVWLQQAFPKHARPDMREATEEEIALLEEYAEVRLLRQDSTEQCDKLENRIKLAIGDREGLEWPGGQFTWRLAKGRVNWKSVALGLLHQYVKDEAERETLLGLQTAPAARRIHFVSEAHDISDAA
jgi:putative phage-type endonuclease